MSLHELESAVAGLSRKNLAAFSQWFEEFRADAWDRQIEADAAAGRLDPAARQADDDFDAGRCTPLWFWISPHDEYERLIAQSSE